MKIIYNIFTLILLLFTCNLFFGCSDEFANGHDNSTGEMTDVIIRIPSPMGAAQFAKTRAVDPNPNADIIAEEGEIKSLWLCAYPIEDAGETIVKQLALPSDNKLTNEFKELEKISFKSGKYRFYLVANLESYLPTNSNLNNIAEENLKEIVLNFSSTKMPNLTDGLPMAALNTDIDEATEGIVDLTSGGTKTISANLAFLCAKIRYTLLFDNSESTGTGSTTAGFSNSVFGNSTIDFTDASASSIISQTPIIGEASSDAETFLISTISLSKCEYPENIENYPSDIEKNQNLAPVESHNGGKRAWQGIIYLPENLTTSEERRTTLTFNAKVDGRDNKLQYNVPLLPKKEDDKKVERGHFYDLIAKVTTPDDKFEIIFKVEPWNLEQLTYNLHGQYFLHIDQTSISLKAGETKKIWFETDASELKFDSPKYKPENGDPIPLYNLSTNETNDSIYVSVNPAIPVNAIAYDDPNFNFFHIQAGTIHKKIDIKPLDLTPYLYVDPKNFTIDVRERIGSGEYAGYVTIAVETNLKNIQIEKTEGWDNVTQQTDGNYPLLLLDGNEGETSASCGSPISVTNGYKYFRVKFQGLNSSYNFWKNKYQLKLKISAPIEGSDPLVEYVTINTLPAYDDYVIHFKGDGWTNPHIYVYQCLEFPGDLKDFHNVSNQSLCLASKPIGYQTKNEEYGKTIYTEMAALEYSFTGKIAFKGWDDSYNHQVLYDGNNEKSLSSGKIINGFYMFENNWDLPSNAPDCDWNCASNVANKRYYTDMDFCKTYRESTDNICTYCKTGPNTLWPGIQMKRESDGWWEFRLTGIATPGKALIMFTDGHNWDDCVNNHSGRRYPAAGAVGIPLFDYPSREGWFYADGDTKQFQPSKPDTGYRIYWKNESEKNYNAIHIWNTSGNVSYNTWNDNSEKFHGTEIINGIEYRFYDFEKKEGWYPTTISFIIFNSDNQTVRFEKGNVKISDCQKSKKYMAN